MWYLTLCWACATVLFICVALYLLWAGSIGDSVGTAGIAAVFGFVTWMHWDMSPNEEM